MSSNTHELILHIGLHKTGTSYLQEHVFPKMKNVNVIRGWFSVRNILSTPLNSHCLVTDEGISGSFMNGNWEQDFFDNLNRVKNYFGDPKIIVGFRKPHQFIGSCYKQYLHAQGTNGFDYLFNWENSGLIKKEELLYRKRIDFLKEHFSEVFVYTQDSLRDRPQDFLNAVCDFLNVEQLDHQSLSTKQQNKSMRTVAQVNFLRKANRFNHKLKKSPVGVDLYNKYFKKLNISPVHINLNVVKNIKSPTFKLDNDLITTMKSYYQEDWKYVEQHLSY